jgi:LmbE family N-acetylglucosaminyl deacetylase
MTTDARPCGQPGSQSSAVPTLAAFHAHPDDEVLLTGGTLAAAAAAGYRVVLVTATRGESGLTEGGSTRLGDIREAELRRSAARLGCHEVVLLDHPDSGMSAEHVHGFAHGSVQEQGEELVTILRSRGVDILLGYDSNGGYGHPDHLQVHRVARYAAARMPDLRLLEATIDRAVLNRAVRMVARLPFLTPSWDEGALRHAFSSPTDIDYRVNVRAHARTKRAAMREHRSQAVGGSGERLLALLSRLPLPLYRLAMGREWYVDPLGRGEPFLGTGRNPVSVRR